MREEAGHERLACIGHMEIEGLIAVRTDDGAFADIRDATRMV